MSDFPCCEPGGPCGTPEAADADPQRVQLIDVTEHSMVVIVGRDNKAQIVLNCSVAQAARHLEHLAVNMLERSIMGEIQTSQEN